MVEGSLFNMQFSYACVFNFPKNSSVVLYACSNPIQGNGLELRDTTTL